MLNSTGEAGRAGNGMSAECKPLLQCDWPNVEICCHSGVEGCVAVCCMSYSYKYDDCAALGNSTMTIKYRPRCFLDVEIDSKPGNTCVVSVSVS